MPEVRKDILFMYKYYSAKMKKYMASRKRLAFGLAHLKEIGAEADLVGELSDIIEHLETRIGRIENYLAILEKKWGMGKKQLKGQKNFSY